MPGQGKYTQFDPIPSKDPAVGKATSNVSRLKGAFKTSPLKNDGTNRTESNKRGEAFLTPPSVDDGGYMFGVVDLDYKKAPDFKDVKTGGGGLPSTAWSPNVNSPGEGNGADPKKVDAMDPKDLPTPNLSLDPAGDNLMNPIEASKQVSAVKLGDALVPGRRPGAV